MSPGDRRGGALLLAVLAAALAALAALTAATLALRELRTAFGWSAAGRIEAAAASGLHRALAQWPTPFAQLPVSPGAVVEDSFGGASLTLRLTSLGDSMAALFLVARITHSDPSREVRRRRVQLVRLVPDLIDPARVSGRPVGASRDAFGTLP